MKFKEQLGFWSISLVLLVMIFSRSLGGFILSLYFVTFLFPVILGTSLFFNYYLVPKYLLLGRRVKFALFSFYMLIISIYLELIVMVLAFVILADYKFDNLGKFAGDIYLLTIILYLIVFANGFIEILIGFKQKSESLSEIDRKRALEKQNSILLKVNRKNVKVQLDQIIYIESLSDYVKVYTHEESYITKKKISSFEESLPEFFIRIHRSFLINRSKIDQFNKEFVVMGEYQLNIGRKYKEEVFRKLAD